VDAIEKFANAMHEMGQNLTQNLHWILAILAFLWIVQIINSSMHYRLNIFGIYPRHPWGLIGIFTSPALHGSYEHLIFNCFPLFILGELMFVFGQSVFLVASILIIIISGSLTWLFGRRALHVGASGVIMGYWSYLLIAGYHQRSIITIGLAVICLYYFAGFIGSMIPGQKKVSWEGHLFGFLAGIAANYLTPSLLSTNT
jgi:membrane associated rhomboid family serine protease